MARMSTDLTIVSKSNNSGSSHYSPSSVVQSREFLEEIEYFDLVPTCLFKSLEDKNWDNALHQAKKLPASVRRWVIRKDLYCNEVMWRRLPIHEACIHEPTDAILSALISLYPASVRQPDNNGRLPLHLACIHGAETGVVYLLLLAYPSSTQICDAWGKTPKDCALSVANDNCNEIVNAFNQGPDTWALKVSQVKRNLIQDTLRDAYSRKLQGRELFGDDKVFGHGSFVHDRAAGLVEQELALAKIDPASDLQKLNENVTNEKILQKRLRELESKMQQMTYEHKTTDSMRNNEIHVLSNRNTNLKVSLDKLEAEVTALESSVKDKDRDIAKLQQELEIAKAEIETNKKAFASEKEQLKNQTRTVALKEKANVSELKEVIRDYEAISEEANKSIKLLMAQLETNKHALEDMKEASLKEKCISKLALTELNRKRDEDFALERAEFEEYRAAAETRMDAVEDVNEEYQKRIADLEAELDELNSALDTAENQVEEKYEQLEVAEEELERLANERAAIETDKVILQCTIGEMAESAETYQSKVDQLTAEIEDLRSGPVNAFSDLSFTNSSPDRSEKTKTFVRRSPTVAERKSRANMCFAVERLKQDMARHAQGTQFK